MPVQPQLFPEPVPDQPADAPVSSAAQTPALVRLMQRVSMIVLVFFCVDLGVFLIFLPWWPFMWDHNLLFAAHPALGAVMRMGVVRGLISGVGALDIWIGISEAMHYQDR